MIELYLDLPESCELDFELLADVPELLFYGSENNASGRRRSRGAAFSALAPLATLAAFSALASFSGLSVFAFRIASASRLRTHEAKFYTGNT